MVILKSFDGFIGKYILNIICSFYVYEHFGGNKNLLLNCALFISLKTDKCRKVI